MKPLIKFIFVNEKKSVGNNWDYINKLKMALEDNGVITNASLYELADDWSAFEISFENSAKQKIKIVLEFGTYLVGKQLEITICSDDYIPTAKNDYMENMKIFVKNELIGDWEQTVWLFDKDAEVLSVELYNRIFMSENRLRRFINEVLLRTKGISWWDNYVNQSIKNKYAGRQWGYKAVVEGFRDIDDHLLAIDVEDLNKIIKLQTYKNDSPIGTKVIELLDIKCDGYEKKVINALLDQLVVDTDLWTLIFSKYFNESYDEVFHLFSLNRNHVAHNKILDRAAYRAINKSIDDMDNLLDKAEKVLYSSLTSQEVKRELERQKAYEAEKLEEEYAYIKEMESGVRTNDREGIMYMYSEALLESVNNIEDAFRFRLDIEFVQCDMNIEDDNGIILIAKSKVSGTVIKFIYDAEIDDSEGAESVIEVKAFDDNDNLLMCSKISYVNGEAEWDDVQGCYMPIMSDELSDYDVNCFVEKAIECIGEKITDYTELVDKSQYSRARDGEKPAVAEDIICYECGAEYVCIDENIAPVGTCLNCGEHIQIVECERCGTYFEDDDCDDAKLCDNCKEYYEEQ